jgi:hypothetical protein
MCDTERFVETHMRAAGLGEAERDWLHLLRLYCLSFEHNRAEGWDSALSVAEARYGADDGPGIASRIAVLIRAMREERQGGFGYLSPHCPSCRKGLTEDEWHLLRLMQAGCLGDRRAIAHAAAEVARRPEAPVLAAAATRFGTALAAAVAPFGRPSSTPGLRLH